MSAKVVSLTRKNPSDLIAEGETPKRNIVEGIPYPSDITELARSGKFSLTSPEVLLLHTLRSAMNPKNKSTWKSQERLAEEMGYSRSTVNKAATGLKKKGLITVSKRGKRMGFAGNEYTILFPWPNRPRNGHMYASKSPKRKPEKQTHIRPINKRTCDRETDTNQSRGNKSKGIDQSNSQGEPEVENKFFKTDKNDGSGREEKIDGGRENLKDGETYDLSEGSPPPATEDELKKIYGDRIPPAIDVSDRDRSRNDEEDGFDFKRYFSPFQHDKRYDGEGPGWWEDQVEVFWRENRSRMWTWSSKPDGGGPKNMFKRAARAGCVYRLGFRPKSQEQIETEKEQEKHRAAETHKRRKLEAEKKAEQQGKDQKLSKFLEKDCVREYFGLTEGKMPSTNECRHVLTKIMKENKLKPLSKVESYLKCQCREIRANRRRSENRKLIDRSLYRSERVRAYFIDKGVAGLDLEAFPIIEDEVVDECLKILERVLMERHFHDEWGVKEVLESLIK